VNFFKTLPEEVGWPALILRILGLFLIIQKNEKRCSISIVYAFLSSSVILKLFYRNEYNPHHWEIHQTFNLVPIVMLCLAVLTTVYSGKSKLRNDYGKWC